MKSAPVSQYVKILGVDFGDPYDIATFSGSSFYFWSELHRQSHLVDVFTPYPAKLITTLFKIVAFNPSIDQWRANWRCSTAFRKYLSLRGARIAKSSYSNNFNTVLQIGAYYNLSSVPARCRALVADNNCAIAQRTNPSFRTNDSLFRKQFDFEKRVYNSMDLVFCFSEYLAKSMVDDFECDPAAVKVIGAGINVDGNALACPNRNYASKTILFCGYNWKLKGGEILLNAFSRVSCLMPEAKLVLIGPSLSNLPKGVVCYGPLNKTSPTDLQKILHAFRTASVFVLPTLADAYPNVIREAMAASLPCVASELGAIGEMVEHGRTGYLVPPNNPDVLAERLIKLLQNPELAGSMGEAGYEKYYKCFRWEAVCDEIVRAVASKIAS